MKERVQMNSAISNWESFAFNKWSLSIPIILVLITLISALVSGMRRGLYGGLITLSFGLSGWIVEIFCSPIIASSIANSIILKHKDLNINFDESIKPFFTGLVMLVFQIIFLSVGGIVILIFRNRISKAIIQRKNNHISTIGFRSLGGVAAVVGTIPCSIMVANVGGLVSINNDVIKANNAMLNIISFKRAKGAELYTPGLMGLSKLTSDYDKYKVQKADNKNNLIVNLKDYFGAFLNKSNYIIVDENNKIIYDKGLLNEFEANLKLQDKKFYFEPFYDSTNNKNWATNQQRLTNNLNSLIKLFTSSNESFSTLQYPFNELVKKYESQIKSILNIFTIPSLEHIKLIKSIEINVSDSYRLEIKKQYFNKTQEWIKKAFQTVINSNKELKNEKDLLEKSNILLETICQKIFKTLD